jgi:hypothetical protein
MTRSPASIISSVTSISSCFSASVAAFAMRGFSTSCVMVRQPYNSLWISACEIVKELASRPATSPRKRGEGELCGSDPGNAPFLHRLLRGNDGMSRVGFISSIPSQPRKGGIRGRAQGLMGCPLFKPGQALDPAFRGDDNPLIEPAPFRAVDYVSGARARFDLSMLCRSAFSENAKSRRVAARPAVDDPFAAEIIVVEQTGSRRPQSAPARRK